MKDKYFSLIRAFSNGLDSIEITYLGAATHHAKRVACICTIMAQKWAIAGMKSMIWQYVHCYMIVL